jgi:hypothetical protein
MVSSADVTRGSALTLPLVVARHLAWARRDQARALVWGHRLGYVPRVPATNRIELVEAGRKATEARAVPDNSIVGALQEGTALAASASFLGLEVRTADVAGPSGLVECALSEGWRLLGGSMQSLAALSHECWGLLTVFLRRGGVLFLADVRPESDLHALGHGLAIEEPQVKSLDVPSTAIAFPGSVADFAQVLAGTEIETAVQGSCLRGRARPLVLSVARGRRHPSVVEIRVGAGRVVLSSFPVDLNCDLSACFGAELSPVVLPPLMVLKQLFGEVAWHAPAVLANFTVDDPALREGLLGLPYSSVSRVAREHDFHVTVATIPAELHLAQPEVLAELRRRSPVISACYHGWNHDGYEFYRSSGSRLRFRPRSLEYQRWALRRAAEAGRRFAQRTSYALNRVMVFPDGLGPAAILPDLHRLGFLASCNLDNRYPLEAEVPTDPLLGVLPADTAWSGFPLLWRRYVDDPAYMLDIFIGRPALTFEHRRPLGRDLLPFVNRAEELHRLVHGEAAWRNLEEVARHAYLQRLQPGEGWQALMTSNEACLHNPDAAPRSYRVLRPDLPPGSRWETEGDLMVSAEGAYVTVPPGATVSLRLLGEQRLPRPATPCSIFPGV